MGNPEGSLGGDWEGEEGGDADRRPAGREERRGGEGGQSQGGGGWGSRPLGSGSSGAGLRAGFSPLELRRLLLSGDVVVLRSGEGSGWDAGAGRVALPLRMSMTCGTLHDHLRTSPAHTALPLSISPGSRFLSLLAQGASPLPQDVQEGKSLLFFGPQSLLCLELTPMRQAAPARLHALTLTRTRTLPHPLHTHATHLSHPCTPALGHRTTPHSALTPHQLPQPPTATSVRTHPAAARHHKRCVIVAVLEAAVCAAPDQRAHEREEPAAGRRVQRRAAGVHLRVHVGAVLRAGRRESGPPPGWKGAGPRGVATRWGGARPGDGQRRVETGNRGGTKRVGGRHRIRWPWTRQPRPRQRGRGQRRDGYRGLGLIVDGVRAEGARGLRQSRKTRVSKTLAGRGLERFGGLEEGMRDGPGLVHSLEE